MSKVFPAERVLEESMKMAATIASFSLPVVMMAKEAVNAAENNFLSQGLLFERRLFQSTFAMVNS